MPPSRALQKLRTYRQTVEGQYGSGWGNLFKSLYYSLFRINAFDLLELDLRDEIRTPSLEPEFTIVRASEQDLKQIRNGRDLPREFYHDQASENVSCYVLYHGDDIAYIHWLYFAGTSTRFSHLGQGVVEIDHVFTMPKFRGRGLCKRMLLATATDMKADGASRLIAVIHRENIFSLRAFQGAGFKKQQTFYSLGPLNRRYTQGGY